MVWRKKHTREVTLGARIPCMVASKLSSVQANLQAELLGKASPGG
jgi:hypothetical protein